MSQKVRKQIYIEKRQEALLKRLARTQGISEAEVIREAIDKQASGIGDQAPDPAAWEQAYRFMLELQALGPLPRRQRSWTRSDLYEERVNRHANRPD